MKPFTTLAVVIFAIICVAHIIRWIAGWPVTVNNYSVPGWISLIGAIVAALMAVMVWRENRK